MSGIIHRKHRSRATAARPLALSTLVTGIALGVPALAAGTPASPAAAMEGRLAQLPTINVTAQRAQYKRDVLASPKFTQPLLDTPQTVNVIGKQVIQQQGATTLTDALRNSPGVGTFYVGENGSTGIAMALPSFSAMAFTMGRAIMLWPPKAFCGPRCSVPPV